MLFKENKDMELLVEDIEEKNYAKFKEGFLKLPKKAKISFNAKAQGIECKTDDSLNLIQLDSIKCWKNYGFFILVELVWGEKFTLSR